MAASSTGVDGASVCSASGHAQDEDALYEEEVATAAPFVTETSHKEQAVLGATREIRRPNLLRSDVGTSAYSAGTGVAAKGMRNNT